MDCREAQTILSAIHDGEVADEGVIASAREHLTSCSECAAFEGAIAALDTAPQPKAPAALAERIAAALRAEPEPADVPAAPESAPPVASAMSEAKVPTWLTRTRLWTATAAITISAAAIVLSVFVTQQRAAQLAVEQANRDATILSSESAPSAPAAGAGAAQDTSLADRGLATKAAPAQAPRFVSLEGRVYRAMDSQVATASDLTTIGAVTTALDGSDPPTALTAYRWSVDPRGLVARLPSGDLQVFSAVVRVVGQTTYQLETGQTIARYGDWPTLPTGIPAPSSPDGSPGLEAAGTDSLGVSIFKRVGQGVEQGFAVAPGTTPSDPAAGNPNWTWWAPIQ